MLLSKRASRTNEYDYIRFIYQSTKHCKYVNKVQIKVNQSSLHGAQLVELTNSLNEDKTSENDRETFTIKGNTRRSPQRRYKTRKGSYNDNNERDFNERRCVTNQVIQCLLEEKLKTLNTTDQDVFTLCSEGEIEKEIEDSEAIVARIMGVNNAITETVGENKTIRTAESSYNR